jgi:hypothetical protein
MNDLPFYWVFIALAALVDLIGLFYLWRRRNSTMGVNHKVLPPAPSRLRLPLAERRRRDRRGRGQAASA